MNELLYMLWLAGSEHLSVSNYDALYTHFGSFEKIYKASVEELRAAVPLSAAEIGGVSIRSLDVCEKILEDCSRLKIDIVGYHDTDYPQYLREISGAPKLLYRCGTLKDLNSVIMVSVVGTRRPSAYGSSVSYSFGYGLAREGITVVSGMARGIDSQAHRGALKAGGSTVAVLGCGADVIYPPENKNLKEFIESDGCIITEFAPGTKPLPQHFPSRNRIISGMSLATVIVEGEASSGSTITARLALEQGREVYCVPGCIDNPLSVAPNQLIREGSALVTSAADIIVELTAVFPEVMVNAIGKKAAEVNKKVVSSLSDDQQKIVSVLHKSKPVHIDEICFVSGLEISVVNQCLLMLEINKLVVSMPGRFYVLTQ